MTEVSRVRSTKRKPFARNHKLAAPVGKEQIQRLKLPPYYVAGFIDGEGSFSVTISKHATLKRGLLVLPEFEIEVRADDRLILERIMVTIGAGKIYDCSYERYGWFPHVKYKVTSTKIMRDVLFPFLDAYPLQAKKAEAYKIFKQIVIMVCKKEHLSDNGFQRIVHFRDELRKLGKKAKTFGNR